MAEGCRGFGKAFWRRITKRKHIDTEDTSTQLKRCLSTKRLIFIGVGKTVGVGIYVLIGIATQNAGRVLVFVSLIIKLHDLSSILLEERVIVTNCIHVVYAYIPVTSD